MPQNKIKKEWSIREGIPMVGDFMQDVGDCSLKSTEEYQVIDLRGDTNTYGFYSEFYCDGVRRDA